MSDDALDCEVVTTRAGAQAVRDRITGELMHPVVGPQVEAERLYLSPSRLAERLAVEGEPLVLLDVGLGAGSNALAAWKLSEARTSGRVLEIVSFDRSLDALALAIADEHAESFGFVGASRAAARAILERREHEAVRTRWRCIVGTLPDTLGELPDAAADVVFWDPFSPKANPQLWTMRAFRALRRVCRAGATVHTYSGATATRSALLLAGFAVGVGPETGANKSATFAATDARDVLAPLDARWLERIARSSAPFPADAPPDALDRVRTAEQFR